MAPLEAPPPLIPASLARRLPLDLGPVGTLAGSRFLAEAGPRICSSLDRDETLHAVVQLAVQHLADWCLVDLLERDGELRRVVVAHADPAHRELAERIRRYRIDPASPHLELTAIRTGEAVLVPSVTPEYLAATAQSPEHFGLLADTGVHSMIAVPLLGRSGPIGAMLLGSCRPRRRYDEEHVRLAAELARRAALAVDNARRYGEVCDAVRARDEALAVVAHDLRSPLATIVMAADVLLQEGTAPALRTDIVRGIRRAARHANRLVAEYLDGARLAEGHVVLDLQATSVDALLAESVALVQRQADGAGLAVTLDLEAGLPPVRVDLDRIVEVFTNLLGNALKFTPAGGRVVVRARAGGDAVVCTVEDTGIGIPADALPHVFERFWQSSGQRGRGAGLGLAICKGIVDAHGGRIWIESEPGAGTRVHFTLPVAIAPRPNG